MLLLSYRRLVTVNVLCLFLTVKWVGLQCVIVVFPDHTHLLFVCTPFGSFVNLSINWQVNTLLIEILTFGKYEVAVL